MTNTTARKILKDLSDWFPKNYPPNMTGDTAIGIIKDITESFKDYRDDAVVKAYKEWHIHFDKAPTVANIRGMLSDKDKVPDNSPTTWSNYFEDADGYGYALNSKTKDYDCIWKPHWKNEREFKGQFFPAKVKSQELKRHGIVLVDNQF